MDLGTGRDFEPAWLVSILSAAFDGMSRITSPSKTYRYGGIQSGWSLWHPVDVKVNFSSHWQHLPHHRYDHDSGKTEPRVSIESPPMLPAENRWDVFSMIGSAHTTIAAGLFALPLGHTVASINDVLEQSRSSRLPDYEFLSIDVLTIVVIGDNLYSMPTPH